MTDTAIKHAVRTVQLPGGYQAVCDLCGDLGDVHPEHVTAYTEARDHARAAGHRPGNRAGEALAVLGCVDTLVGEHGDRWVCQLRPGQTHTVDELSGEPVHVNGRRRWCTSLDAQGYPTGQQSWIDTPSAAASAPIGERF